MKVNTNIDCRYIQNGITCDHLSPWNIGHKDEIPRICTCKALNCIVFPEYVNFGKMTQKLIQVEPLFDCPAMQKLRLQDKAPHVMATITNKGITT